MCKLRFYAEERQGQCKATCLDLGISVHAKTLDDAKRTMPNAIDLYLEALAEMSECTSTRVLEHRSPLSDRMRYHFAAFAAFARIKPFKKRTTFTIYCDK